MIFDYVTLKFIWFIFIGVLFIGFAVTGGFDLGVGALLPLLGKTDEERRTIINSIGPTWEGNQVWLLTAAGALFAAWPILYATAFSSLYFALLLLLFALILRPPGFDYRGKIPSLHWRNLWDFCLFLSGFLPAVLLGVALGNLFVGLPFHFDENLQSHYEGGFFNLLNPFSLLCGLVSFSLFLTHGAIFLQLKTINPLQSRAQRSAIFFGILFILSFSLVWYFAVNQLSGFHITVMPDPNESFSPMQKEVGTQVGDWSNNYQHQPWGYLAPLAAIIAMLLSLIFSGMHYPLVALFWSGLAIAGAIVTAGFTLFPFILPSSSLPNHSLTIWDVTSSKLTLTWMFYATLIFLPIVISYTLWVYFVMRGKVKGPDIIASHDTY